MLIIGGALLLNVCACAGLVWHGRRKISAEDFDCIADPILGGMVLVVLNVAYFGIF